MPLNTSKLPNEKKIHELMQTQNLNTVLHLSCRPTSPTHCAHTHTHTRTHTHAFVASLLVHKSRVLQNLLDLLKAEEEGLVVRQKKVGSCLSPLLRVVVHSSSFTQYISYYRSAHTVTL